MKEAKINPEVFENFQEDIEGASKVLAGYEQVKTHMELWNWAVRTRFETLSTVSALAGTLLIVATFNDKLIILDDFVRILLSILIILIPSSLWGLFYEAIKAEKESFNRICLVTEETLGKEAADKTRVGMKSSLRGAIPLIVNIIFTIVVLLVVILIWR